MSSIIRQIFNIFPRFSTKKAARRRCRAVFSFFPEQVVDGGAESGRQIVQLVVSDDSAAVLDPADEPADSVHRQADHDSPLWGKARSEKGGEVTWQRQRHLL